MFRKHACLENTHVQKTRMIETDIQEIRTYKRQAGFQETGRYSRDRQIFKRQAGIQETGTYKRQVDIQET